MAKKQSNPVQPVEEVRIGAVKAAIWKNEGEAGTWFNVTFQRLYRTEEGQWQSTNGFAASDLLLLAKLADAVHTRVLQLLAGQPPRNGKPLARAAERRQGAAPVADDDIPY